MDSKPKRAAKKATAKTGPVVAKLTQSQREWAKKPPMELSAWLWSMTIAQLKTLAQTHKIDMTGVTDRDAAVMLLYSKLHTGAEEEADPEEPADEQISSDTSEEPEEPAGVTVSGPC